MVSNSPSLWIQNTKQQFPRMNLSHPSTFHWLSWMRTQCQLKWNCKLWKHSCITRWAVKKCPYRWFWLVIRIRHWNNKGNFGAPGCVVALSNVPHKAVIADILDFFRGYNINEKCVIRRFGPNGVSTGDARVAFRTTEEAQMAVQALQNEFMLNRRVALSII